VNSDPKSEIKEWQKRLTDTFTVEGLVGGSMMYIFDKENKSEEHIVTTFHGQSVLMDSFQSFFADTLTMAIQRVASDGWPKNSYAVALAWFLTLFRRCRACELLFVKGYPLEGYALIRDIRDRAFMMSATAHNMVTIAAVVGAVQIPTSDPKYKELSKKERKKIERRVNDWMIGQSSGLSSKDKDGLKGWSDLFDLEVHGGRLSLTQEIGALSKPNYKPEIGPAGNEEGLAMYMNRAAELNWLIVRLLPFLQRHDNDFGEDWNKAWTVLDDSFRYMVESLGSLGKEIAQSFIAMVDSKFVFKQPLHYFEPNGTVK
jgi:hypothetical protein